MIPRALVSARVAVITYALVALFVLPGSARAQESDALDADPRAYDTVWIDGIDIPIVGTILSPPDSPSIKIKKKGETIAVEFDAAKVKKTLPRQTAAEALKERADRIHAGSADDHHKLGDWAWRQGLEVEGLGEMRKAVAAAPGAASAPHRARLARMLLLRRSNAKLDANARDEIDEELEALWQKTEKAGAQSPEVELGRARALLAQRVAPLALQSLEKARATLAKQATEGSAGGDPPAPDATPKPGDSPKPDPVKTPKGRGGDAGLKGGGGAGGGDDDKPADNTPALAPEDKSAEKWPGLSPAQRDLYREVLLTQAEALLQAGRAAEVGAALVPLLEAFPQHRQAVALSAEAKLLIGDAKGAIEDFNRVIAVAPKDAAAVRDRGIANYAAGQLDAAKEDLEKAIDLGLDDPRPARAHLGLVHLRAGRFHAAEAALKAANQPEDFAPAKLGLALLAELQGKPADAAALAEAARSISDQLGLVDFEVAQARERELKHDQARSLIRQALLEGLPFPVGARWLAASARSRGDAREELRCLEELVGSVENPTPDDLYALGRAYLSAERLDDAKAAFDRALAQDAKHVPCLLGAGYVLYRQDDREGSRSFFQQAIAIDKTNVFGLRALKNLEDARTRRVWIDRFDRETADVENGWLSEQSVGVNVALKDKKVVFSGTQAREDLGKTKLFRDVVGQQALRVEVRLDLKDAADARCGIRFETDKGSMILFRDQDGALQAAKAMSGGIGNAVYDNPIKVGEWPVEGRSHVLAIEIEAPDTGNVSWWLDDQRLLMDKIAAVGRATKAQVTVYGQAKTGSSYGFSVEEVRVYAKRTDLTQAPKGGGF